MVKDQTVEIVPQVTINIGDRSESESSSPSSFDTSTNNQEEPSDVEASIFSSTSSDTDDKGNDEQR